MGSSRDVLVFSSPKFSVEAPTDERGRKYDLPLGDDLAAHLKKQLEAKTTDWKIDGPVREDFGSVLSFAKGKKSFSLTIIWAPIHKGKDNTWALQFAQSHGCLGIFLKPKDDGGSMEEIKTLVERVVLGDDSSFSSPTWMSMEEFRKVY